ncbi:hypothetical protein B566_EDAN014546 [Ephemera danica]|nr:hypothetical protein B566_EDAN014546 [Ephemera danica]
MCTHYFGSPAGMKLRNVLISDAVDPACVELLQQHGISVTLRTKLPPSELIAEVKVTAELLAAAPSLKLVGRAGTGVDNIDLDAATKRGVIVMNTPGGNSISACELTCTLIACLARHVAPACAALKQGSWERKQFAGNELYGKTLAVLGLGRIGREVARRMQSFGMKTIGYDPIISAESAAEFNVEKLELDDIWPQADYITVHTPLIPQTRNLLNAAVFNCCRRGVQIVNVARGGIVDEAALLDALESGHCGGAALDVFTEEPPRSDALLRLLAHPRGQTVSGIVNAPIMATALEASNTPWIKLAQYLGCMASHLVPKSLPGVTISVEAYGNELAGLRCLSTAVLLGQLAGATQNGINLINAPALAREAGISVESSHHTQAPIKYAHILNEGSSGLRVCIKQAGQEPQSVTGTVRDGLPLLLAIGEQMHFSPQGLALRGNVALFKSNNVRANLTSLVGAIGTSKTTLLSMSLAIPEDAASTVGYIALNTTNRFDVDDKTLQNVVLVAQNSFA